MTSWWHPHITIIHHPPEERFGHQQATRVVPHILKKMAPMPTPSRSSKMKTQKDGFHDGSVSDVSDVSDKFHCYQV